MHLLTVPACVGKTFEAGETTPSTRRFVCSTLCACATTSKATVLLVDIDDYKAVNEVYAEFFGEGKPARAAFAVKALPAGALVEIDAISVASG